MIEYILEVNVYIILL